MLGFQDWKKARCSDGGLSQHAKCEYHMNAMLACAEYDKLTASGSDTIRQMHVQKLVVEIETM